MSIKIYPYRVGSRSARALADALGCRILRRENSRYSWRPGDLIVNWGSSDCPAYPEGRCLNKMYRVEDASNKRTAFLLMHQSGVSVPEMWERGRDIPEDSYPIVCRTVLNGHSGRGIHIANTPDELVPAPLYVRYIKKRDEYRVHVFKGDVIAVQQKRLRNGHVDPDFRVRNCQNGFVFTREGVHPDDSVLQEAVKVVSALNLDFGAVDVIWNEHQQRAYVLEVNCAPGLEGQTVWDYASAITRYYNGRG